MLHMLAWMTRTEFVLIDEETTRHRFEDELHWNHESFLLGIDVSFMATRAKRKHERLRGAANGSGMEPHHHHFVYYVHRP
jgi:hypothetical protein